MPTTETDNVRRRQARLAAHLAKSQIKQQRLEQRRTEQQRLDACIQEAREAAQRLLTVRDVARALRVTEYTVRGWIHAGTLPALKLPGDGLWRVPASAIDELLRRAQAEPNSIAS